MTPPTHLSFCFPLSRKRILEGKKLGIFLLNLEAVMIRIFALFLTCLLPALAFGQVPFPPLPQPMATFSFEDKDWNVEAPTTPHRGRPHAPTPTSIPGARVIKTLELKALLDVNKDVVVVDVLDSKNRRSIPGAFWLSGAGDGQFFAAEKNRFAAALEKLTGGDKTRPLVFLCISSECWLSYNASLYALEAGYKDVIWYRGGTNAWTGASLDWTKPESVSW
ncbi:MAG TPA: rhodanese-like domain-containing protein [Thauera sp.]|nr:rhodanese-like domain-containing protein [Thauera sp.]